jgi:hypothetical protein
MRCAPGECVEVDVEKLSPLVLGMLGLYLASRDG